MAEFRNCNQEYCDIGPKTNNTSLFPLAGEENGSPSGRQEKMSLLFRYIFLHL